MSRDDTRVRVSEYNENPFLIVAHWDDGCRTSLVVRDAQLAGEVFLGWKNSPGIIAVAIGREH